MTITETSLKDLMESLEDGVYFVDTKRKITYWNKGAELITGFTRDNVVGTHCYDNILNHVDETGKNLCLDGCPLTNSIKNRCKVSAAVYLHHKEGYRVPVTIKVFPLKNSLGKVIGAVEVFRVKTENEDILGQLKKMAFFDTLTEVGNRRRAESTIKVKLAEKKRYGGRFGLLFIDIDDFKNINDTFGHKNGDLILKMVAQTINKNIRPFDIISRWGGEEFLVSLEKIKLADLATRTEKLRMLISKSSFFVKGRLFKATVSVGGTLSKKSDTLQSLVDRADKLMYKSKIAGKNRVTVK